MGAATDRCRLSGQAIFVLKDEAEAMRGKLEGKMGMSLEVFANAFRARIESIDLGSVLPTKP